MISPTSASVAYAEGAIFLSPGSRSATWELELWKIYAKGVVQTISISRKLHAFFVRMTMIRNCITPSAYSIAMLHLPRVRCATLGCGI